MEKKYMPISDLQIETLNLVNKLIEEGKSQQEIWTILSDKGYHFRGVATDSGRLSKTKFDLVKWIDDKCVSSFVTLVQDRRSKKTSWETIGIY